MKLNSPLQYSATWMRGLFNRPFRQSLSSLCSFLNIREEGISAEDRSLIAIMKTVLLTEGHLKKEALDAFRLVLGSDYSEQAIEEHLNFLATCETISPEGAIAAISQLPIEEQRRLIGNLIALAIGAGTYDSGAMEFIRQVTAGLKEAQIDFDSISQSAASDFARRRALMKSGAGLIIAIVVIIVFILAATWLKSVLFGTIFAYIFLPLEKYFEKHLRHSYCKRHQNEQETPEVRKALIGRATTLTVSCVMTLCVFLLFCIIIVVSSYFSGIRASVSDWVEQGHSKTMIVESVPDTGKKSANFIIVGADHPAEMAQKPLSDQETTNQNNPHIPAAAQALMDSVNKDLDTLKTRFQSIPIISWGIGELGKVLHNEETQQQLFQAFLRKSGGFLSFTASVVSVLVTIILDILLTFFFFSLILGKLALFANDDSQQSRSEYIVLSVFNGKWLPGISKDTLSEGEKIISEVIDKLRCWLRGYLLLMMIDVVVYTTVFTLLGVPYSLILGAIAAFGLLLLYIGPIASALLTVLVTLATGENVSGLQIAGVVGIYLLQNGVIEQFILYPRVIGNSLGLTTLETIIVVLLGGYFAGITGMIFAMPTASVIKYLFPKIYDCLR